MVYIICLLIGWFLVALAPHAANLFIHLRDMVRLQRRQQGAGLMYSNNYIEVKSFYVQLYRRVPCISFINSIDTQNVYQYIRDGKAGKVLQVYQRTYYNWTQQRQEFSTTLFILANKTMIEMGDEYAEILFSDNRYAYAKELMEVFKNMKAPEKERAYEINIITINNHCLELKTLGIEPTQLNLALYYNDDFLEVDKVIRERLLRKNDKGIILLHGLPGTGKTTYLRHLIGSIDKKVLFVSPAVASNLMNPEFIDLLIDNPNAVLVIEDAENIIMDRRHNHNSSVSNLLNISDGLLSDCLNVQIICTFNNNIQLVDNALMRKGRLIAKYEFGKLTTAKAQQLSNHLGFNATINVPMTIAEITHPGDMEGTNTTVEVLGFRRDVVMN